MVELEQKLVMGYWSMMGARPYDACATKPVWLHYREDGAFLCPGCHTPTTVTCCADATVLCSACDANIDSTNPLTCLHERIPIAPFFGALTDAS